MKDAVVRLAMVKRAFVAGALLFSACFSSGGGSTTPTTPPPGNTAPAAHGPDYSATLADPFGFLPVDSEMVLGLDADAVRRSSLWPLIHAKLSGVGGPQLTGFAQLCGFDPITSVHAVSLGMKHIGEPHPDGVIVVHGLDRQLLMGCVSKIPPNNAKGISIEDGIVSVPGKDGDNVAFAFVDASSLVAVVGADADKTKLRAVLKAGAPLRSSPTFTDLAAHTDVDSALWAIMNGNSKVFDQMASIGAKPKAVFGSLVLQAGLGMNVHLRLDSAAQAQQLQQMAIGQVGMVKSFVDKLDITAADADVVFDVAISDQQLTNLLQMAGVSTGGPTP